MWRIELFGEPRVTGYGQTIRRFGSKRAVALLAYLALHPRTRHSRESLADRLWPEASPEAGRNNLKQTLASLRRILEPPGLGVGQFFDADRSSIGLTVGSYVLDVDEFRQALKAGDFAKAVRIKVGEFMPGFYDEWLEDFRFELELADPGSDDEENHVDGSPFSKPPAQQISLPGQISSFVGREVEVERLRELLLDHRWITLTGLGGIGKTTLAIAVGRHWNAGDCFFVPLTEVTDPAQIAVEILRRVGLAAAASSEPLEALAMAFRDRPTLLILDNLEQLASPETAETLEAFLTTLDSVRILVSSRVPIRGRCELDFAIFPLPVPGPEDSLEEVGSNASARLFVDRARQVRADFQVTERNLPAMREVCRLLEGVPLAIELCAAWTHALSPAQLAARLEKERDVLVSRRKEASPRHRSLHDAFLASCELLHADTKRFLAHLAVFRGGWDLELASAIVGKGHVLEHLSTLIESALIFADYTCEPPRYGMLESLRQVAAELLEPAESAALNAKFVDHMAHLAQLSSRVEPMPSRGIDDQAGWNRLMRREWANFRAAVLDLLEKDPLRGIRMVIDLEWHWTTKASSSEPAGWLRLAIDRCPPDDPIVRLAKVVLLAITEKTYTIDEATKQFADLIREAEASGDKRALGEALLRFAQFQDIRRTRERMLETALQSVAIFQQIGYQRGAAQAHYVAANWFVLCSDETAATYHLTLAKSMFAAEKDLIHLAACYYVDARVAYHTHRFAEALVFATDCLSHARQAGDERLIARICNYCYLCLKELGEHAMGRVYLMLSVQAFADSGDWSGAHYPLWNLGIALSEAGRHAAALKVISASIMIWQNWFGGEIFEDEQLEVDRIHEKAGQCLTELEFHEALARGKKASPREMALICRNAVLEDMGSLPDAFKLISIGH